MLIPIQYPSSLSQLHPSPAYLSDKAHLTALELPRLPHTMHPAHPEHADPTPIDPGAPPATSTPHTPHATHTRRTPTEPYLTTEQHPTCNHSTHPSLPVAVGGPTAGRGAAPQLWTAHPRGRPQNIPIRASKGMTCPNLREIGSGRGRGFSLVVFPTPLLLV